MRVIGYIVALAAAEREWWHYEWMPRPSSTTVAVLLAIIAALLGVLIAIDIMTTRRHRAAVRRRNLEIFDGVTRMHGLGEAEIALLRRLAVHQPEQNPAAVVNSPAEYDACVETELAALARRGAGEAETENALELIASVRHRLALDHLPHGQFLHSTRGLLPNQEIKVKASMGAEKEFDSVVVAVTEKEVTITAPRVGEDIYHLDPGAEIEIAFVRQSDAIYRFRTRVLRTFFGRAPLVTVAHSVEMERVQLRRYYRIDVNMPISFALLNREEIERGGPENEDEAIAAARIGAKERDHGVLKNISGGGALVESGAELGRGDFVNFDIDLWSGRAENLTGEIVSVNAPPSPPDTGQASGAQTDRRRKTTVHLTFVGMSDKTRDKVVKYVFRKQLEEIREAREKDGRRAEA